MNAKNSWTPIHRALLAGLFVLALAPPVWAQLFGVVFDPTNYGNALLRYAQLQQQYAQLVATYQQIRQQYLLLQQQARLLPVDMNLRYRSLASPWLPLTAATTFRTTAPWIEAANTGARSAAAFTSATEPLVTYAGALGRLPAAEAARVRTHYDRTQLAGASVAHGLEALGVLRGRQQSMETAVRNLENDAYANDAARNTQIAVLNKVNATGVTSARLAKDANNLLISLLEEELIAATDRRDAAAQTINAHIAFLNDAPPLLTRSTAQTTGALSTFRIP